MQVAGDVEITKGPPAVSILESTAQHENERPVSSCGCDLSAANGIKDLRTSHTILAHACIKYLIPGTWYLVCFFRYLAGNAWYDF